MDNSNNRLLQIFFDRFANDSSKFLVPRLPFVDNEEKRRVIDFAIVSTDPGQPRVAILIRPLEDERTPFEQLEVETSVQALMEQNWVPVLFSPDDIAYRPRHVRIVLDDIFAGRTREYKTPEKKNFFGFLADVLALFQKRNFKNADVAIFAVAFTFLLTFSTMKALSGTESNVNITNTIPQDSYVLVNDEIAKKSGNKASKRDKAIVEEIIDFEGNIIPVINLDKSPVAAGIDIFKGKESDKVKAPIYLGTVRYCLNGMECLLQNDTRIRFDGVQLPADPKLQEASMVALNQKVAGQKIKLEVRKNLPEVMVVKASLGQYDIAMEQVEQGYLVPHGANGTDGLTLSDAHRHEEPVLAAYADAE